jgi:hypothetical protein
MYRNGIFCHPYAEFPVWPHSQRTKSGGNMSTAPDEFQELKERAEEAAHDRQLAPVSFTMAVLAVLLAICGTLGHRAHTEEGVALTKAADTWAFYQAKNGRRFASEIFLDQLSLSDSRDKEAAAKLREKYEKNVEHYGEEQKEIEAEARKLQDEVVVVARRATRFDLGDTFLEIALVITSITLLTRKRSFWMFGMVLGLLGVLAAASSLLQSSTFLIWTSRLGTDPPVLPISFAHTSIWRCITSKRELCHILSYCKAGHSR